LRSGGLRRLRVRHCGRRSGRSRLQRQKRREKGDRSPDERAEECEELGALSSKRCLAER
jgi:hypothetical protein